MTDVDMVIPPILSEKSKVKIQGSLVRSPKTYLIRLGSNSLLSSIDDCRLFTLNLIFSAKSRLCESSSTKNPILSGTLSSATYSDPDGSRNASGGCVGRLMPSIVGSDDGMEFPVTEL